MSAQAPQPKAQGDLSTTPFAHLIAYVRNNALTGSLVLWEPESRPSAQHRLFFEHGQLLRVRVQPAEAEPSEVLRRQFSRSSGRYAFYEEDLVGRGASVRVLPQREPFALIVEGLRHVPESSAQQGVLQKLEQGVLRLRPSVPLAAYAFDAPERNVVDLLRAEPNTLDALQHLSGDAALARRVAYALALSQSVERLAQLPEPSPSPASEPAPDAVAEAPPKVIRPDDPPSAPPVPDGLAPELGEKWKHIAERAAAIEHETYFQMLDIPTDAGADRASQAYLQQVKLWHPDRLPQELGELRPWVQRIFRYLTDAKNTLTDETQRGRYFKAVQGGGGTPAHDRRLEAVLTAAMEFQKVEILARRRNWEQAWERLETVLELNPEEADYLAMKAYLLFQRHGTDPKVLPRMLEATQKALELDPANELAHLSRAQILKRQGRAEEALSHFRKVVEINPQNLEAARELRLAEMRSKSLAAQNRGPSTKPPPANPKALLDKLFKKKK